MKFHFGSSKSRQLTYKRANWVLGLTTSLKSWAALEADAGAVWAPTQLLWSCPALLITPSHCQCRKAGPVARKSKLLRSLVSWIDFPEGSDQNSISRAMIQRPQQNRQSIKVYHLQGPRKLRKAERQPIKYLCIDTHTQVPKSGARTAWSLVLQATKRWNHAVFDWN